MIKGKCFSNDESVANEKWPTTFVAVPRVGDRVRSLNGTRVMKVASVIHCEVVLQSGMRTTTVDIEPQIEVELGR